MNASAVLLEEQDAVALLDETLKLLQVPFSNISCRRCLASQTGGLVRLSEQPSAEPASADEPGPANACSFWYRCGF